MRNYSSKSNKQMTRYRTPSTFKVRQAEYAKKLKATPFHDPGRGRKTSIGKA